MVDLDAALVLARSENKQNAAATYKGGIGFCPNLATCDNTDDVLVVDPRPGNATANDAADNIATLTRAVERLPGAYRSPRLPASRINGARWANRWEPDCRADGLPVGRLPGARPENSSQP